MKEFIAGTQRGRKLNILGSLESIKSIESIESMESLESIEMDSRREHAGMTVFRYIVFSKLLTFNFQLSTFFVPALNLFLILSLIKWETHGDGTINCQLSIINYQLSIARSQTVRRKVSSDYFKTSSRSIVWERTYR